MEPISRPTMANDKARDDANRSISSPSRSCTAARAACAATSGPRFRHRKSIRRCRCLLSGGAELGGRTYRTGPGHLRPPRRSAARSHRDGRAHARASLTASRSSADSAATTASLRQVPLREREVFDRLRMSVQLAPGEMLVLDEPARRRQPPRPLLPHRRFGRRPAAKADSHPPGRSAAQRHLRERAPISDSPQPACHPASTCRPIDISMPSADDSRPIFPRWPRPAKMRLTLEPNRVSLHCPASLPTRSASCHWFPCVCCWITPPRTITAWPRSTSTTWSRSRRSWRPPRRPIRRSSCRPRAAPAPTPRTTTCGT